MAQRVGRALMVALVVFQLGFLIVTYTRIRTASSPQPAFLTLLPDGSDAVPSKAGLDRHQKIAIGNLGRRQATLGGL